jgi:homospermidine synthase
VTQLVHTRVEGALVMIGFGSIGRGVLPLIERHIGLDRAHVTVIEPSEDHAHILRDHGIRHLPVALTAGNFSEVLRPLFPQGRGMIVNLSAGVDSVEAMKLAQEMGVQYSDTVVEPWRGSTSGPTCRMRSGQTIPCARTCGPWAGIMSGARRRFPAAGRTRGWSRGF